MNTRTTVWGSLGVTAWVCLGPAALAEEEPGDQADGEGAALSEASVAAAEPLQLGGWVETYYQWNLNRPSNGITNMRGFDNRHNTLTLSAVALDARWSAGPTFGRLTLQGGQTAATYYLAEPTQLGGAGAGASSAGLWRLVQQANAGMRLDVGPGIAVSAGTWLSPIGPESMAVKDNWTWSRSNLFFGLPFYHTGARMEMPVGETSMLTAAVYNGWNSIVDNNPQKSGALQWVWTPSGDLTLAVLYFGGVERPPDAPEGAAVRHLFDAHATVWASRRASLLLHVDAGVEANTFGLSSWLTGAAAARVHVAPWLSAAVRVDGFREHRAASTSGEASSIFWPAPWLASGTLCVDAHPGQAISFRLEARHDRAGDDAFYAGEVEGDGVLTPFVANSDRQTTVTLGATSWF